MVMELLGPNLDDLMSYCEPGLSMKSVIMIADQLVKELRKLFFFILDIESLNYSPKRLYSQRYKVREFLSGLQLEYQ
jgi:hypothetical protein